MEELTKEQEEAFELMFDLQQRLLESDTGNFDWSVSNTDMYVEFDVPDGVYALVMSPTWFDRIVVQDGLVVLNKKMYAHNILTVVNQLHWQLVNQDFNGDHRFIEGVEQIINDQGGICFTVNTGS